MKRIVLYITVLLSAAGCMIDSKPGILNGDAEIAFSVALPESVPVASRTASDTDVENIDVLMFDHTGAFMERIKIDDISGTGATKYFSLRINFTPNARTFHIVANGRDASDNDRINYSDITPSMNENAVMSMLRTMTVPIDESTITPLVMWGRVSVSSVLQPVIDVNSAKLLRSLAAVIVQTDSPTAENGLGDFVLESITLCNASSYGYVAPLDISSSGVIPDMPRPTGGITMVDYDDTGYWSAGSSPIYMYERENSVSDYVSLIVKGSYKGTTGYYRIAFVDDNDIFMDIVRNHQYTVNIVKAEGVGHQDMRLVMMNPPANTLKVSITDNRDDIFLIVADGQCELGVSVNHIELRGTPSGTRIELATIFATRNSTVTAISSSTNLTNLTISAQGPDGTRKVTGIWNATSPQPTEVIINDGYLKQIIKVESTAIGYNNESNNSSTYVVKLFDTTNKPWRAEIVEGATNRARLHYRASSTDFSIVDTSWGFTSMESRTHSTAYLHMLKTGNIATIQYSCLDSANSLRVGRMIINQ